MEKIIQVFINCSKCSQRNGQAERFNHTFAKFKPNSGQVYEHISY